MQPRILKLAAVVVVSATVPFLTESATPKYKDPIPAVEVAPRKGVGNFLKKLRDGKPVTVAYLGGSITAQGDDATGKRGWRVKTTKWLRETFPKARIKEVNAAIGGTGSALGVFRLGDDVLRHDPDLVFVEFACNDGGDRCRAEKLWPAMEGIVRQTWRHNPRTDIVFAYTITEEMTNSYSKGVRPRAAGAHDMLAKHYGIPSIDFGPRVWKAVCDGRLVMSGKEIETAVPKDDPAHDRNVREMLAGESRILFSNDGVHPRDEGHDFYFLSVKAAFSEMRSLPPVDHSKALAVPFFTAEMENAKMVDIGESMLSGDWTTLPCGVGKYDCLGRFSARLGDKIYIARKPGSKLSFSFRGSKCQIYDFLGPDCAQLLITVDGKRRGKPVPRFDRYCTYYRLAALDVFSGEDGVHTVEIEVDSEQPSRQAVASRLKDPARELKDKQFNGTTWIAGKIMLVGEIVSPARDEQFQWKFADGTRMEDGMLVSEVAADSPSAKGMACAISELDGKSLSGKTVRFSARVRGENVKGNSGLKFMLRWTDADTGATTYTEPYFPGGVRPTGDFAWTNLTMALTFIGTTVVDPMLYIGLQNASGKVYFDLSSLKIEECDDVFPYVNQDLKCRYTDLVAKRPRMRGAMSASPMLVKEDDLKTLSSWGAKLYRYQMHNGGRLFKRRHPDFPLPERGSSREEWQRFDRMWLDEAVDHLVENVLPWARKYGMMVVVDMHQVPGGFFKAFGAQGVFTRQEFAEDYFDAWRRIARRLKGNHDVIYGYDLMNEPHQKVVTGKWNYWTIQGRAALEIRKIDPVTPIVFNANEASSPEAFRYFSPVALDNIIYQVHFYRDNKYTHGRWTSPDKALKYPDESRGFDKEYLRRRMVHARRFQEKHGARIYCGEFSACGWAPGAERWMQDVIDIMEEYGWDWTYHAFREAPMWSVEHVFDGNCKGAKAVPSSDNPRMRVLKDGFRKGEK